MHHERKTGGTRGNRIRGEWAGQRQRRNPGGLWALLVSLAALRSGGLPRGLNILGLLVGAAGIISLIPGLTDVLIGVFGMSQIIWFVWLGIVLLRSNTGKTA